MFVSAGTDGLAHIHSLLQVNPVLSLRVSDSYVFQVQWSPTRPLVFAAATGQGATSQLPFHFLSAFTGSMLGLYSSYQINAIRTCLV